MNKESRDDLEKLDALRERALCGPEGQREEAQLAYEELRSRLLEHEWCNGCDGDSVTQELNVESKNAEAMNALEDDKVADHGWESNRNHEPPHDLPWPEENESKE
jgi:hypothetical protein